jgi:hypothetical protein
MRSTIENLLMSVDMMRTINERTISQEMNDWISSFMMNQTTPHLGGTVIFGKQREQKATWIAYDKHYIYN